MDCVILMARDSAMPARDPSDPTLSIRLLARSAKPKTPTLQASSAKFGLLCANSILGAKCGHRTGYNTFLPLARGAGERRWQSAQRTPNDVATTLRRFAQV